MTEKYYLQLNSLYIEVDKKIFDNILHKISEDYMIVKENQKSCFKTEFVVYYAVDTDIPFADQEQIGYIKFEC